MYAPDQVSGDREPPRASLIAIAGELCGPALLMGGAHTPLGNDVRVEGIERAWLVDCAGEMPGIYRERAGRFFIRVFPDLDGEVAALPRLRTLAAEISLAAKSQAEDAPERVYVMCHHGMNRSGLVAGLILRELGVSGADAVARILAARPGSLSNQTFRAIVERG
ncbi:MAG: protein-tyrosine phosphatase family protein [Dehalococcoidia bacterium]